MQFLSFIWHSLLDLRHLHKYARDILRGALQVTVLLYLFAGFVHLAAPYTDYMRAVAYRDASLENAPVVLAVGVIGALLCDLVLRKKGDESADAVSKTEETDESEPVDKD